MGRKGYYLKFGSILGSQHHDITFRSSRLVFIFTFLFITSPHSASKSIYF